MMKKRLTVIFTCFNRKDKTTKAMRSLVELNKSIDFNFIIVDDNSTDGTVDAIKALGYNSEIIKGTGNLYWCGGMRVGIEKYLQSNIGTDCLLVNDDVDFFDTAIEDMVRLQDGRENVIIVGATCDQNGTFTYGLRIHRDNKSIWLNAIEPNRDEVVGDTMNANCVLISNKAMMKIGNLDSHYSHSLGDYDLGFRIKRMGYKLISSAEYVGHCEENGFENSWRDPKLGRIERIKKKESPKGSPFMEWWHFLYSNYNLFLAIKYSVIPYVKILIGK
ncbi:glycosyltransferase family 2 protein [Blautia sp. MCC269]|jgi:GT2 family glycosyltransferase|uniref:glycosyltransferase family 2 protein n=1 Tax=Blautia sp. MCC269 TaxID=2592638 RepID=UPI001C00FEDF|nr:glycosyltransferase [Blautia sp. MCC269]MBT9803812.1 glycosyltransferase [Blautia sp. MCC269]